MICFRVRSFFESFEFLFPRSLSIWLFCYVRFVPIFYSKIVLCPCHLVVGMSSHILSLLAGRIFDFVLECPVLSVSIFTPPPFEQDMTQGQFLSEV